MMRLALALAAALVPSPSPSPSVHGSLDKEVIRGVIRRHLAEVQFCYERSLRKRPELAGKVMVQFTIVGSGAVSSAAVQSSTLGDAEAEQCICDAMTRWQFPPPAGGGMVIVSYPFVLKVGK
jgi:TonB family protein